MSSRRPQVAPLRSSPSSLVVVLTALLVAIGLSGCVTGERPTLSDPVSELTGDPVIDGVISLLNGDAPDGAQPLVATYTVLTKFGNTEHEAVFARDGERRSVTVGAVRYLVDTGVTSTCNLRRGRCINGIDESRVSDVLITSRFTDVSPVARLRQGAERSTAPAVSTERTIAGEASTCADVSVTGGVEIYCAIGAGILTLQDTADVRIELTDLTDEIDESLFTEN